RAMKEVGVFCLATPRAYGGLELDPLTQVRVVEELSSIDGSVGWCAMIGIAGGYASAFLDPAVARRLFGNIEAVLAGQVVPVGRAELIDGGYRVSGRWRFGSGCRHATIMMGGCTIFARGEPRLLADGQPETRLMLLPASACTIIDTWQTAGLRG
ncbi:MAG: hydrolase, partial [Deltaproteobacteria bacterium]